METPENIDIQKQLEIKDIKYNVFKGNLVEFKSWLSSQRCIIAPDSMAGHLGAYVGIPVFTIFGSQNPNLTNPLSAVGSILTPENLCTHKRDHWRLCHRCTASISPKKVFDIMIKQLSKIESEY